MTSREGSIRDKRATERPKHLLDALAVEDVMPAEREDADSAG